MIILYFIVACISMALGAIGVILPIIPTTPFLLLSAFCFAKSSKRFHTWFTNTSLYKKHLESFVEKREMKIKTKITLLVFASSMLLIAMYLVDVMVVKVFIGFLIAFKYYYFTFRIKTVS